MKDLFVNVYELNGEYSVGNFEIYHNSDRANNEATKTGKAFIGTFKLVKAEQETEQPQPEPQSQELKTMLIADAIKQGLKCGDKIWVELEVNLLEKEESNIRVVNKTGVCMRFDKESVKIMYNPPYIPKQDEHCRFKVKSGNLERGICVMMKGLPCGVIDSDTEDEALIFVNHEIEYFLPLE